MRKRACDSCYRRKIQCDAASPRCDWCRHHDLPCTFDRPISTRRRGKAKKHANMVASAEPELHDRAVRGSQQLEPIPVPVTVPMAVAMAEAASAPIPTLAFGTVPTSPRSASDRQSQVNGSALFTPSSMNPSTNGTPDSASLEASTPSHQLSEHLADSSIRSASPAGSVQGPIFGKLHFAGRHLGDISLHNGIPFLSDEGQKWIASRTGESAPFRALTAQAPLPRARHGVHPAFLCTNAVHLSSGMGLPERRVVEECLGIYAATPFKRIWPVMDTVLFQRTIEVAYREGADHCSIEAVTARACIFSFLSLLALHHMYPTSMPSLDSEECAVQAQYLLPQVLQETTIVGLQACFMLSLYHLLLGQLQKAAVIHSVACRMMYTLGANTIVVPALTSAPDDLWRVKNQLRKLFWLIYCNDKEISLRTGQPPSINDDDCDLTLPQGYLEHKYVEDMPELEKSLLDDTAVPLLPGDLRLDIIKSKTYTLLYSARAMRKSDAEVIRAIRQLDDELEAWRLSVPPGFRPSLSLREEQPLPDLSEPRKMERLMINVEYHHLVAIIHEATGRCRSWSDKQSFEMEGVSSSLELAVEASRSTMFYIRSVVHNLMGEVFWMAVFYPISAVWTIFWNIIYNPINPNTDVDLDLLNSAPMLIKKMRLQRLARDEMAQMKMVDDFVTELVRLANCAVHKARQESRHIERLNELQLS
ncbi:hypothetical protein VTG60DRAFT_4466 [Thermothelomyces hinnuleus]